MEITTSVFFQLCSLKGEGGAGGVLRLGPNSCLQNNICFTILFHFFLSSFTRWYL